MALRTPSRNDDETSFGAPQHPAVPADGLENIPTVSGAEIDALRGGGDGIRYTPTGTSGVYDDQKTPLGDGSDPRMQNPVGSAKKLNADDLRDKESLGVKSNNFTQGSAEREALENQGFFRNTTSSAGRLRGRITRQRFAGLAIIVLLSGGGFAGFAVLQGPLQFIHFAQNLQKHMKSNEDFGNERTSKVLLYALAGKGAQNGRLGVTGNYAANKWEKRLLKETGLRPVYSEGTRRFVGFEIVDDNKAQNYLSDIGETNNRNSRNIESIMGNGAEIRQPRTGVLDADGNPIRRNFIDLSGVNFGDRRTFIRSIGRATQTHNIASSVGSRVLISRAGVNFHPLNKVKRATDDVIQKILDKRRANIENGVQSSDINNGSVDSDGDGQADDSNPADVNASDETQSYIDEFREKGVFKTAGSGAVVVGVLCAAQTYGKSVDEYKYQNNYLPMLRTGMSTLTAGNQVMSGDDVSLASLGIMNRFFYDEKGKTGWNEAESVRAEAGRSGGVPVPPEAQLKNIDDKPELFRILDKIPLLKTSCDLQEGFFNLPIIKNVTGVLSDASDAAINGVLKASGTGLTTEKLMESSLKAVAGRSVNPDAEGADFGNFANIGAFLGANEQAIASGGRALSDGERSNLALYEEEEYKDEYKNMSVAERYIDPLESKSLISQLIDSTPSSKSQVLDSASSPFQTLASGFVNLFMGHTRAAGNYDYGVPKYGFALSERRDDLYENPYENATREVLVDGKQVSLEDDLPRLNEEYGKECFGVEVTADDTTGVHVKQLDEKVNVFKIAKNDKCNAEKNRDDRFNQYRFYIADAMTALSLACYEGNEEACSEITGSTSTSTQSAEPIGNADLKKTVTVSEPGKFITMPSRYSCPGRTTKIDSRIAASLAYLLTKYDMCVDDGLASGHKSHGAGLGVDIRPRDQNKQNSKDEWKKTVEAAARDMGWTGDSATDGRSGSGCAPAYSGYGQCVGGSGDIPKWVRWIGYNGDVDHGDPWHIFGGNYAHIHIGWASPNPSDAVSPTIIGSPISEVYTFPAPLPDDLKDLVN